MTTLKDRQPASAAFARASGISSVKRNFDDAAALVAHLFHEQPAARRLFIVANEPMLYFLAGRIALIGQGNVPPLSRRGRHDRR